MSQVLIIYSAGGRFYAIPSSGREVGIWLSVEREPLPVSALWHAPGIAFAAVMRGRDYYRVGTIVPQHEGPTELIECDSQLARDYADAAWWTPGLEEAWAEADGMREAMDSARVEISRLSQLHVCEASGPKVLGKVDLKKERK